MKKPRAQLNNIFICLYNSLTLKNKYYEDKYELFNKVSKLT
jgi:hypothetical protein